MTAIPANSTFTFVSYAVNNQESRVDLTFHCDAPGGGNPTEYTVALLDSELANVTTTASLRTLVTTKLQRLVRATGIASKLDPFIGQSVVV